MSPSSGVLDPQTLRTPGLTKERANSEKIFVFLIFFLIFHYSPVCASTVLHPFILIPSSLLTPAAASTHLQSMVRAAPRTY